MSHLAAPDTPPPPPSPISPGKKKTSRQHRFHFLLRRTVRFDYRAVAALLTRTMMALIRHQWRALGNAWGDINEEEEEEEEKATHEEESTERRRRRRSAAASP